MASGKGGVGKSTISKEVRKDSRFWLSISCTTRPARANEVDGLDYHFISTAKFDELIVTMVKYYQPIDISLLSQKTPLLKNTAIGNSIKEYAAKNSNENLYICKILKYK